MVEIILNYIVSISHFNGKHYRQEEILPYKLLFQLKKESEV